MGFKKGDRVRMTEEHDDFFTEVPGTIEYVGRIMHVVTFDEGVERNYTYSEGCVVIRNDPMRCPLHGEYDRNWNIYPSRLEMLHPQMELFRGNLA